MKVEIQERRNSDGLTMQRMFIDEKEVLSIYPLYDCPEDAIIGRGLISCNQIAALMERAYKAGLSGEPFMFSRSE